MPGHFRSHGTLHGGHQGRVCQPGLTPAQPGAVQPGAAMFHVLLLYNVQGSTILLLFLSEVFLPFLLKQSMKKLVTMLVEIELINNRSTYERALYLLLHEGT